MDSDGELRAFLDRLGARASGPFGDVASCSGRTLQRFSFAAQRGAENLLTKARLALDDQDVGRAEAYVDQAVRMPLDEQEQAHPAALAVHMELFCAVTDALEQAEQGDSRWLDAALGVLSDVPEAAACDLRDVLVSIDHDYALSRSEHRRLGAAIAAIPDRDELRDLELTTPELREHVMAILRARCNYDRVWEALVK
jgi:hypothetical protein